MVELFAVLRLTRTPDLSGPVIVVANNELPTPARLSEPWRPESPGRDLNPLWDLHPLGISTALDGHHAHPGYFSVAQAQP